VKHRGRLTTIRETVEEHDMRPSGADLLGLGHSENVIDSPDPPLGDP